MTPATTTPKPALPRRTAKASTPPVLSAGPLEVGEESVWLAALSVEVAVELPEDCVVSSEALDEVSDDSSPEAEEVTVPDPVVVLAASVEELPLFGADVVELPES